MCGNGREVSKDRRIPTPVGPRQLAVAGTIDRRFATSGSILAHQPASTDPDEQVDVDESGFPTLFRRVLGRENTSDFGFHAQDLEKNTPRVKTEVFEQTLDADGFPLCFADDQQGQVDLPR